MEQTPARVRLGAEELALALSLAGRPDLAKGLLYLSFGELAAADERGRLLAAGHALLARRLLVLRDGQSHLAAPLVALLAPLVAYDYTLNYSRRSSATDETLSYFIAGTRIVEQRVEHGVVYELAPIANAQAVIAEGLRLFDIQPSEAAPALAAGLPVAVLDQAKELAATRPAALPALFQDAGLPPPLNLALADDFRQPGYRGAVLRVETHAGQSRADQGVLLLRGTQRTWLFPLYVHPGQPHASILPGTPAHFTQEVQKLLAGLPAMGDGQ